MHLGSTEIVRLAGMLAFRDTTDEGLPLYGMSQRDFSRHSIYTAVLMGGMAAKGGLSPSMAYTLGLIRGLGHWFIQEALRSHNMGVRPYTGPLGEANLWEEDKLQINHAEFAANTLRQFRLSGDLLNTLAYYLRPHAAGNMAGATLLLHCTEQAVRDILPSRQMDPSILPGDWYLHYAPEKEFRALQIRGQQMLQSLG